MNVTLKEAKKKLMHVIGGTVLTEDVLLKNTRFMVLIFIILALYISNRYSCIEKVAEIEKLQRELKDAKYESLTISAELVGLSREGRIKDLVAKKNLELERTNEPIYKIKK